MTSPASPMSPAQFYAASGTENWLINPVITSDSVQFIATATFTTGSFAAGAALVEHINELANAANHHPDVTLTYPAVTVTLTTHDAGGAITELDAQLAAQISAAAAKLGASIVQETTPVQSALLERIVGRKLGAIATTFPDGRPQVSTVVFAYAGGVIRASVTDDRVKVRHLRRDPRVVMHIVGEDGFSWVAAEGVAVLGQVTTAPDDAAADELVEIYQAVGGAHDDWAEFRRAMVAEKRLVMRLVITRTYGNPPARSAAS